MRPLAVPAKAGTAALTGLDPWRSPSLAAVTRRLAENEGGLVADLGGLNQPNLDYVCSFGCRVYAVDLLTAYKTHLEAGAQSWEEFLRDALAVRGGSLSAVLAWDCFQFLRKDEADRLATALRGALVKGGVMMALFHAGGGAARPYGFRTSGEAELTARSRNVDLRAESYSVREIERLFSGFEGIKFYLTRGVLQEVVLVG